MSHPPDTATEAAPEVMHPSVPDTVSVLLFAGFSADRVTFSARGGLLLNGTGAPAGQLAITRTGTGIAAAGAPLARCTVRSRTDGTMELSIGRKRKQVRGPVEVTAGDDRLRIVARMALRDYLAATLGTEAASSEPMEYLVALAVVQRNYLASHRGRHGADADLCDNTHCQLADLSGGTSRIYEAASRAMKITLSAGEALPCYYSANCGGATLTPAQVWRTPEPGYANVSCNNCRRSQRHRWQRRIDASPEAEQVLRNAPAPPFVDDDFKIRLGRIAGFNKVLSNTIDRIERRGRGYLLSGRGFGHRIGLCMEGARELALHGRNAGEILRFYFPAAHISTQR